MNSSLLIWNLDSLGECKLFFMVCTCRTIICFQKGSPFLNSFRANEKTQYWLLKQNVHYYCLCFCREPRVHRSSRYQL
jgi:hypothetical protein